ncbi:tetratricopeptide repeat protein [Streptomyces sp. NPDC058683]|uniref:tetratricopeptide repeat protein n=1 Tax=Streptomyces sp. NPDC058683 TaxID=3346597 RepID=UPI003667969A
MVGTLIRLGRLHRDTGATGESYDVLERARRMAVAAMGPDHPYVADAEADLAETLHAQDDRDGAVDRLRAAVRRYEAAYGTDHVLTVRARTRLHLLETPRSDG